MCLSNAESFDEEGNSYVIKMYHFYCKCKYVDEYIFNAYKYHPFIGKILNGMQSSCSCRNLGPFEVCDFCVQVKYLINFHTYKLCIKSVPENIAQHLVPLNKYLQDEMTKCELLWKNVKKNLEIDFKYIVTTCILIDYMHEIFFKNNFW